MYIYILNYFIELRPCILGKIPFGEILTSGECELKAGCQVCCLRVSKGEMEFTAISFINYIFDPYILKNIKMWNKEEC